MTINVIINEQHSLMEDQERCLNELVAEIEEFRDEIVDVVHVKVPAEGWTIQEMDSVYDEIMDANDCIGPTEVVFVSPIPYLIKRFAGSDYAVTRIFHNDHREKKDLPDGRIIHTVAKEGWELV